MFDSYGDGWNGNAIDVYEDGVLVHSFELASGSYAEDSYCGTEGSTVEFYFVEGDWTYETSYVLTAPDGTELLNESPSYSDGDLMTSAVTSVEIVDCDDTDAAAYPGAAASDSLEDCMLDLDGDGYGDATPGGLIVAGSDCDDNDNAVHPMAEEIAGDGKDSNCDGKDD